MLPRKRKEHSAISGPLKLLVVIITSFLLCLFLDSQIQPIIQTSIENEANKMVNSSVNSAVEKVLQNESLTYDNLLHISYGQDNKVQSVSADTVTISNLKAKINNEIEDELAIEPKKTIYISLGTLADSDMLRDLGPKIPFKFTLLGNSFCQLTSDFTTAGLNQTRHTIYLTVNSKIRILTAKYSNDIEYTTNYPLAETIIVGDVPQVFSHVDSDKLGNLSDSIQLEQRD